MVRNLVPRGGPEPPMAYTDEDLVSDNHHSGERNATTPRHQRALLPFEELSIAQDIATFADCGYAFEMTDLKLFVKSCLDKAGRSCPFFEDNMPGEEWVRLFLGGHEDLLSHRTCQNTSRHQAAVSCQTVKQFFDIFEDAMAGVPPENLVNYDEISLTNDPKSEVMISRKETKHAERASKSSVSLMFACSAKGTFLPPYTVYRAEHLVHSWVLGGPVGARYNRTTSGGFDGYCFKDWLKKTVVPYFNNLCNEAPRVLIGDNLACHLTADVIEICSSNNIKMVFLPPNSTHVLQPLDAAVYAPLNVAWREVLTKWKESEGMSHTILPKNHFPRLLFTLLNNLENQKGTFAVNGFTLTGLYPINRQKSLFELTKADVSSSSHHLERPMLPGRLAAARKASSRKPTHRGKPSPAHRGKPIDVSPEVSVALEDIAAGPSKPKRNPKRKLARLCSGSSSDREAVDARTSSISQDEMDADITPDVFVDSPEGSKPPSSVDPSLEVEVESFVLVRFEGNRSPFHFVGKVMEKEDDDSWNIEYFRRCLDDSGAQYIYFKVPTNPDFFVTEKESIVKTLPKPLIVKHKLLFKKEDIGSVVVR